MKRLGVANARQLARALGWQDFDAERRAHRLVTGATDAQFSTLQPLLIIAGLLDEEAIEVLERLPPQT